jgi:protein-tyrosine-phosphatase
MIRAPIRGLEFRGLWKHLFVPTFQILSVCTANICRSPATEMLLRHDLSHEIARGYIDVESFGTHAISGRAACDLSTALASALLVQGGPDTAPPQGSGSADSKNPSDPVVTANAVDSEAKPGSSSNRASGALADPSPLPDPRPPAEPEPRAVSAGQSDDGRPAPSRESLSRSEHIARQVTEAQLRQADLVLALDRGHRSALARIFPGSRSKTYTLRQAALLATHVQNSISTGGLPPGAPPMPPAELLNERLLWLIGEMDAARGVGSNLNEDSSPATWHPLDIPDPHVIGYQIHAPVVDLIRTETQQISSAIQAVLQN